MDDALEESKGDFSDDLLERLTDTLRQAKSLQMTRGFQDAAEHIRIVAGQIRTEYVQNREVEGVKMLQGIKAAGLLEQAADKLDPGGAFD